MWEFDGKRKINKYYNMRNEMRKRQKAQVKSIFKVFLPQGNQERYPRNEPLRA
jgi:hypothetical protein